MKDAVEREVAAPITLKAKQQVPLVSPAPSVAHTSYDELVTSLKVLAAIAPGINPPRIESVCNDIVSTLRQVVPFDTAAVFIVEESLLSLSCVFADGSLAGRLSSLTIPMAEQLTGWVGANRYARLELRCRPRHRSSECQRSYACFEYAATGCRRFDVVFESRSKKSRLSQRRAIESLLPAIGSAFSSAHTTEGRR